MRTRRTFVRLFGAGLLGVLGTVALGVRSAQADDEADAEDHSADTDIGPDALEQAYTQVLGLPYIWASAAGRSYFGSDPRGFDCSGFANWLSVTVFGQAVGSSTLQAWANTVPTNDPQRGDYAFWNMQYSSPRLQHMGIVLDDGQTIIQSGGLRASVNIASAWSNGRPSFRRLPS